MKKNNLDEDIKRTIRHFFRAWKIRDWKEMSKHCQKTWISVLKEGTEIVRSKKVKRPVDPIERLSRLYFNKLLEYKITGFKCISATCVDVYFEIKVKQINVTKTIHRMARIIRESDPFIPSKKGDWGINVLFLVR